MANVESSIHVKCQKRHPWQLLKYVSKVTHGSSGIHEERIDNGVVTMETTSYMYTLLFIVQGSRYPQQRTG